MSKRIKRSCPKCGADNLYVKFTPVGKKVWGKVAYASKEFCDDFKEAHRIDMTSCTIDKEHLYIACRVCQYDWAEKTMDTGGI